MKNLDIKLENSPLIYRSKLTIPSHINFGLELLLQWYTMILLYREVQ